MNAAQTLITVSQPNELEPILATFAGAGYRPHRVIVGRLECHLLDDLGQRSLPRYDADARLVDEFRRAASHGSSRFRVRFGDVASGDEDIVDRARAAELQKATGALCVAWEGAGAARAARFSGRPFLEVRAITDSADDTAAADFQTNLSDAMPNLAELLLRWSRLHLERRA